MSSCGRVKTQFSEKDFLRATLVAIAKDKDAPADILNSAFGEVSKTETEFLVATASVNIQYAYQVGSDRQEEYWDKEKKYYPDGRTEMRDVKKTRTVTDWSPVTGSNSSKEVVVVRNDANAVEKGISDDMFAEEFFANYSEDLVEACESKSDIVCAEAKVAVHALAEAKCFARVSLAGEKTRDKNYSGNVEIENVERIIFPEYTCSYEYKDTNYVSSAFAIAPLRCKYDCPHGENDREKSVKKRAFPMVLLGFSLLLLGVVLNILSGIIDKNSVVVLCFLAYLCAAVSFVLYFVFKSYLMKRTIAKDLQIKKEQLCKILARKNLPKLTAEEESLFD